MITPLEIQNQEFSRALRGLRKDEVKQFLTLVSDEFELLLEKNQDQAKEISIFKARLSELENMDKVLKDTLISAQQIKNEIQQTARKEAELIIREGQLKAESLYEASKKQVDNVTKELVELHRVRDDILAEAEMMVSRFSHFVEAERQVALESDKLHQFDTRINKQKPVLKKKFQQVADNKKII